MSYIKNAQEIEKIAEGGRLMGMILEELTAMVTPGVSVAEIDRRAERLIHEAGGRPAFKGYQPRASDTPFPAAICASVNDELVHGIPSKNKILREGDILSIDIGMEYPYEGNSKQRGFFTDTAVTVTVGKVPKTVKKLIDVTRAALETAIAQCTSGNSIADVGKAIESYVRTQGPYGIVRDLIGHGVGHAVHEEPAVPNYYSRELETWKLKPGVVIAIEPMITLGGWQVVTDPDHWTIRTKDRSLCAHFEHTVVITEGEPIVATRRPGEMSS